MSEIRMDYVDFEAILQSERDESWEEGRKNAFHHITTWIESKYVTREGSYEVREWAKLAEALGIDPKLTYYQ